MAGRLNPTEHLERLKFAEKMPFQSIALADRVRSTLGQKPFAEYWKYTRVDDFLTGLTDAPVVRPDLSGLAQAGLSLTSMTEGDLPYPRGPADAESVSRFPLADLALLLAGDLLVVRIGGKLAQPIRLTAAPGLNLPLLLILEPGAEACLIEEADAAGFINQSLYIQLGEGAVLEHASTALATTASHWTLTQVQQAASSTYRHQQYQRGGAMRRTETQILLAGRDASAEITGAYLVDSGTHLDQQLVVEHRAPGTRSRQKFHGIGAGKGTAVFNGRIHIHPGAPGSDAELSNRNLALHPDAVINTKPELEIYTDDVKCAHGATVGQISAESLFYLNSRGMDPEQARRMLCRAFIRECIHGQLAERAESALLEAWSEGADP
jgi:Fe-S cluster assembly protein SufD